MVAYSTHYFCTDDNIAEGIAPGDTWMARSRGVCLVTHIWATLTLPDKLRQKKNHSLLCKMYYSPGTTYSLFSIIMDGDGGCCVQSSHESGVCP